MTPPKNDHMLTSLETRVGSSTRTAMLLGVDYRGSYCRYKRDPELIPRYIRHSIGAHMLLPEDALQARLDLLDRAKRAGLY